MLKLRVESFTSQPSKIPFPNNTCWCPCFLVAENLQKPAENHHNCVALLSNTVTLFSKAVSSLSDCLLSLNQWCYCRHSRFHPTSSDFHPLLELIPQHTSMVFLSFLSLLDVLPFLWFTLKQYAKGFKSTLFWIYFSWLIFLLLQLSLFNFFLISPLTPTCTLLNPIASSQ
jgi:hypothetical protein